MLSSLTHKLFGVTYSKTERGGKGGKESRLKPREKPGKNMGWGSVKGVSLLSL